MDAMAHVGWDLVTGGQTPSDFRIIALWWAILPLPGLGLVIVPPEVTFRWLKLPTGQHKDICTSMGTTRSTKAASPLQQRQPNSNSNQKADERYSDWRSRVRASNWAEEHRHSEHRGFSN